MAHWVVERTIGVDTPDEALPTQVPPDIWGYARAFLHLQRPGIRFLWRDGAAWLDVQLVRQPHPVSGSPVPDRVSVRVAHVEMPRGITVRELDVLTLVALGLTNIGISERLGTSARTVSSQIERLLEKLDQNSRGGLAAIAVDLGLLRLPLPGGIPESASIGVAELELAFQHRLDGTHMPIRSDISTRVPLKLGIIVPRGIGSDSEQMLNGALLAVSEINQLGGLGGRLITPIQANVDMFDWNSVREGLHKLFSEDVDAIITSYVSAEHPEFMDLVANFGRPFLHTATFEADVLKAESEPWRYGMIFQTCASETYYGPGMLRVLTRLEDEKLWKPRTRTVVSIEMPSDSMHLATPKFKDYAQSSGWTIADTVRTPRGKTNWSEVVEQALDYDPDVIMIANYIDHELIAFQKAFLARPSDALVYGIYSPSIPSFVRELGDRANGVIWSTTTGTYDDDLGRKFRLQYRSMFQEDPGWSQAGAVYDQVRMLAAAWSSVDARNIEDVIRYLRRWPYRGVNGVYYFGETGQAPRLYPDTTSDAALSQAHLVYQIQGQEHVLLGPEPFGQLRDFELPFWFQ